MTLSSSSETIKASFLVIRSLTLSCLPLHLLRELTSPILVVTTSMEPSLVCVLHELEFGLKPHRSEKTRIEEGTRFG